MSESERNERRRVVAMVGNPTSDKGRGAKVDAQVLGLLEEAGRAHNFDVIDITGTSFDDSLNQARERAHEYDYLVVVGGDGRSHLERTPWAAVASRWASWPRGRATISHED